jgi:endoglucanase
VHGGTGSNKSLKVYVSTADSGGDTPGKIITATVNTWTLITVNLSEIGNPGSIKRLNIQNNSASAQSAVYFDDLKLE